MNLEQTEDQITFHTEELSEHTNRFIINAPKGTINPEQLKLVMNFLNDTDLPAALQCLHQMYFQSLSDQFFTMPDEQKDALEAISGMLIKCWAAERTKHLS